MANPRTNWPGFTVAHVVALGVIVLVVRALLTIPSHAPKIASYSEFLDEVRAGHVAEVEVKDKSLTGKLKPAMRPSQQGRLWRCGCPRWTIATC